jgi:phosphoribosylanthranilate isomerase
MMEIKICGLTRVKEALACARLGAAAIGLVFYPKSPRHVTLAQAREITRELPRETEAVGVFVDETFSAVMHAAQVCRLSAAQLHGRESPYLVASLLAEGLKVIKTLFLSRAPSVSDSIVYAPTAFLVECGRGSLPGGNALAWDWESAASAGRSRPLILAGGLTPENVPRAIAAAHPDAVDVSSGVEAEPGRKDLRKVEAYIAAVCGIQSDLKERRIFSRGSWIHARRKSQEA